MIVTALYGLVWVTILCLTTCDAAPVDCPAGIDKFNPMNGDLFIASLLNDLQRYRSGHSGVQQAITLKPDDHISFYYFTTPKSLNTPMIFALIRAYKIRAGQSTSLRSTEVSVANSKSHHQEVQADEYKFFHAEKRRQPSLLRTNFHMRFADGRFPWDNWDNSYDDVSNPDIYALPTGDGYTGFKAYMQRITGFSEEGRCVVFRLFNRKEFATAVESFSLVLVALADKSKQADDNIILNINFSAPP